jgi:hypothetical protein
MYTTPKKSYNTPSKHPSSWGGWTTFRILDEA